MEFNEEKARQIIDKYNLSLTTLNVWKSRGKIPDRYGKEGYKIPEPVSDKGDLLMQERIISILNMPELNRKTIVQLSGCDASRVGAACVHKSTLTKEEMFALQKEIKRLRLDIVKYSSSASVFLKIFANKRLKPFVIIPDRALARRLKYLSENGIELPEHEYRQVEDFYAKIAIQLNIS